MQGTSDISHILWILQVNSQYTFTFIFNVIFGVDIISHSVLRLTTVQPNAEPQYNRRLLELLEAFENHYELQIHSCAIPRDKLSRQVI